MLFMFCCRCYFSSAFLRHKLFHRNINPRLFLDLQLCYQLHCNMHLLKAHNIGINRKQIISHQGNNDNQPFTTYRIHDHLHRKLSSQKIFAFPQNILSSDPQNLNNIKMQQIGYPRPKLNIQLPKSERNASKVDLKILTLGQLKQQQSKLHKRESSRGSIKGKSNKKVLVTVANNKTCLSGRKSLTARPGRQLQNQHQWSSRKIKLTKYLEQRTAEKAQQK